MLRATRLATFLVALIIQVLPATTQEYFGRYEVVGELTATADNTEMVLPILVDTKSDISNVTLRPVYGSVRMLGVSGLTATEEGAIGPPIVSLVIQISGSGDGNLLSIEFMEKDRPYPKTTEAGLGIGSMELQEFSLTEDGVLDIRFSGELIRLVYDDNYEQSPEEGQLPVTISGTVSAMIPEAYRGQ